MIYSTQRMLLADMRGDKVNVSLDAVRRDNPSLANMISIGEWSFNQLRRAVDYLVNDRSLVGLVSAHRRVYSR